jgi:hypothetical protein
MTTYNWNVLQTDYETSSGFIISAHFQCIAADKDFTASIQSTSSWVAGTPVIPYANVTMAEVLNWIWANGVDKSAIEASLAKQLEALKNPVMLTQTPWSKGSELIAPYNRFG